MACEFPIAVRLSCLLTAIHCLLTYAWSLQCHSYLPNCRTLPTIDHYQAVDFPWLASFLLPHPWRIRHEDERTDIFLPDFSWSCLVQYSSMIKTYNNNNDDNRDDIYGAVIIAKPLREFTRFIWRMRTKRRVAANPQTKPIDLDCESAGKGSYHPHPPSPFIIIFCVVCLTGWWNWWLALCITYSGQYFHLDILIADTHFTVPQRIEDWVDLAG